MSKYAWVSSESDPSIFDIYWGGGGGGFQISSSCIMLSINWDACDIRIFKCGCSISFFYRCIAFFFLTDTF